MNEGIIFALLAAVSFGVWTVLQKLGSTYVDKVFGAIIVSSTAVVLGTIILLPNISSTKFFTDYRGIVFIVLAGVCAFAIDFLSLSAYGKGLPVSVGGPLIIGGSMVIATVIGLLFLGEQFAIEKIVAIILIIAGSVILAYLG